MKHRRSEPEEKNADADAAEPCIPSSNSIEQFVDNLLPRPQMLA